MTDTLFTDVACPMVPKRFLWWTWRERAHSFVTTAEWKEPGHYSTLFYTAKFCTKCWATCIECEEGSGP